MIVLTEFDCVFKPFSELKEVVSKFRHVPKVEKHCPKDYLIKILYN